MIVTFQAQILAQVKACHEHCIAKGGPEEEEPATAMMIDDDDDDDDDDDGDDDGDADSVTIMILL